MDWKPHIPIEMTQDAADIHPRYRIEAVPALYLERTAGRRGKDFENKMLVGVILNYASPRVSNGVYTRGATGAQAVNANGKRPQANTTPSFNKIMHLGDVFPNTSSCFSVVFGTRADLGTLARGSIHSHSVSLGDVVGFYEPRPSDKVMGGPRSGQLVLDNFTVMVFLGRNVYYPRIPMRMADAEYQMVHFREYGVRLSFSLGGFLVAKQVPCTNVTCDRQLSTCRGCLGVGLKRNCVYSVEVEVEEQNEYNEEDGVACFNFRSWRFTNLVAPGVTVWAGGTNNVLFSKDIPIRDALRDMANLVNNSGGWTVTGWHRRGILDGDNEDARMSMTTKGHLVSVAPTNLRGDDAARFELLRVKN